MRPPDELLSWTDDQVEREIRRNLPAVSVFVCEWNDGLWHVRVEPDETGSLEAEHVDRRMALYAIYGQLWLRDHRLPAPGSPWDSSMPRPTTASVTRYVQSGIADPEDLDPVQVTAVYGLSPQKG